MIQGAEQRENQETKEQYRTTADYETREKSSK
jgi:hypothetical protein